MGLNNPEQVEWYRQIQMIPFKKSKRTLITYLDKSEMDELLNSPDKQTDQGNRDHALLLFLYNTGARADEVAQLTIADLSIAHAKKRDLSTVLIRGKGNKLRRCPLWQQTVNELNSLILNREQSEHVFLNRCNKPLTRFGIHTMVRRYVKKIIKQLPSIEKKRVSPRTIRHTTATHLLQAGIDINTIRAWLGHVSINTTNVYAEVDLDMKSMDIVMAQQHITDLATYDIKVCEVCSGAVKVIACIEEQTVINQILSHLQLVPPSNQVSLLMNHAPPTLACNRKFIILNHLFLLLSLLLLTRLAHLIFLGLVLSLQKTVVN